jgi:ATP-binding cassette subfamily B (MDR/TAP) protein 1
MLSGARIARSVREAYLKVIRVGTLIGLQKAILRQNIAYFDELGAGEVTTRITSDISLLQGWIVFGTNC